MRRCCKNALTLLALVAVCVAGPVGCERAASTTATQPAQDPRVVPLPTVQVQIAGRPFTLEVADDDDEREQGLMYRTSMPVDHGMLFIFDQTRYLSFWMENTHIPLDLIYLDEAGKVVGIHALVPHDRTTVPSPVPARYAIELNRGVAARIGLRLGDVIRVPQV